jgi:2-polyprenyl-3-methyl-5-hydroxy-6-metoxy-1,4-benzoquinol methylase
MNNKFLLNTDLKLNDEKQIPKSWWSRPHEYAWALEQLNKNDIIIDAGCGIEHPFKYYASEKCKYVYAVDSDIRVNYLLAKMNMKFIHGNLTDLDKLKIDYPIDKVFCISVLEHMQEQEILKCMDLFRDKIKDNGKIVLTIDYPTLNPDYILNIAKDKKMKIDGKYDYSLNEKAVTSEGLNVFTAVLVKDKKDQIDKQEVV